MTDTVIYHMAHSADWAAAKAGAPYAGSADDRRDGFIRFSTAEQVAESAAKHRAGQENLILVAVEAAKLGAALRWEEGRRGQAFPHLYGPLPLDAVVKTTPLPLGSDGRHVFPAHIPSTPA
jgi:uncharacterized protein (DUF952 family)